MAPANQSASETPSNTHTHTHSLTFSAEAYRRRPRSTHTHSWPSGDGRCEREDVPYWETTSEHQRQTEDSLISGFHGELSKHHTHIYLQLNIQSSVCAGPLQWALLSSVLLYHQCNAPVKPSAVFAVHSSADCFYKGHHPIQSVSIKSSAVRFSISVKLISYSFVKSPLKCFVQCNVFL